MTTVEFKPASADTTWLLLVLMLLPYAVLALFLPDAPLDDLPNHLARAHIISDLLFDDGLVFGASFLLEPAAQPYVAGDLLLAMLDRLVGPRWSARLWIAASLLIIPLAVRFLLVTLRATPLAVIAGTLLSLHMATASTFVWGFLHFQISVGMALFAYGWLLRARAPGAAAPWVALCLTSFAGFALHLSASLFLCLCAGTTLLWDVMRNRTTVGRASLLAGIAALPLLLYVLIADASPSLSTAFWGSAWDKLSAAWGHGVRYGSAVDLTISAGFLLAAMLPAAWAVSRGRVNIPTPLLLCAAVFGGFYIFMPSIAGGIYGLDIRALPYAVLFLTMGCVIAASRSRVAVRIQLVASVILAVANVAYMASALVPQQRAMRQYRAIAALVPAGARVLPVNTRRPMGASNPFHHAGSFATLDAHAHTPYLFARDTNSPQSYFAYTSGRGRAPGEFWYHEADSRRASGRPDWSGVEQDFEYVLVTVPWNAALIPSYSEIARNEVAALLRVLKQPPR